MAGLPNPHRAPLEWRTVRLAGWLVPVPLIAINGIKIEDEWVVQRQIGTSGAVTIWRGIKPTEDLRLTFEAPTEESFDSLHELFKRLRPVTVGRPPTVAIEHPGVNFVGIKRVARKLWEGPNVENMHWRVNLTLIQYFPPITVAAGPADPAKLPGEPTPLDAGEKMIGQIASKINELL